jgi:outer membrane lipoprotein
MVWGPLRVLLLCLFLPVRGCSHTISEGLRAQAEPPVPEELLFQDPEAFLARVVILGGTIIGTINDDEGTYVEVLQRPLDSRGRPRDSDVSYGRFIVFTDDFLDPAVYAEGRSITVAGEVVGTAEDAVSEIPYLHPFIVSTELHLKDLR